MAEMRKWMIMDYYKKILSTRNIGLKVLKIIILIVVVSVNVEEGYSNESFYRNHSRGWHWYERKKREEGKEEVVEKVKSYKEQVGEVREDYEEKLNKAILYPSKRNVKKVIVAQEKIMNHSEKFKDIWLKVVYENPDLDYNVKNPASEVGTRVYRKEARLRKSNKVAEVAKTHGLIFFFKGNCGYCKEFAAQVQKLEAVYGFEVLAVSVDGGKLPEFPRAEMDNGITQKFGISIYPALIGVNRKTEKILPISFGYNSIGEIEDRIDVLYEVGVTKQ